MASKKYQNTEHVEFTDEDILITDPCYVLSKMDWEKFNDYLDEHNYFSNDNDFDTETLTNGLKELGFKKAICAPTIIGDWSCDVIQIKNHRNEPFPRATKNTLGEFRADSGLVAVFNLNEAKEHNPDYFYNEDVEYKLATVIKHFTGKVCIELEEDSDEKIVRVTGCGNVDFYSEII